MLTQPRVINDNISLEVPYQKTEAACWLNIPKYGQMALNIFDPNGTGAMAWAHFFLSQEIEI